MNVIERDAFIITCNANTNFLLWYLWYGESKRPDVSIISANDESYSFPEIRQLIKRNLGKRPIYCDYTYLLELDEGDFLLKRAIPQGFIIQLEEKPTELIDQDRLLKHERLWETCAVQFLSDPRFRLDGSAVEKYAGVYNELGIFYERKQMPEEAIAKYKEIIAFNPTDAYAHYNLGKTYLKRGALKETIGEFKEALALDPIHPSFHYDMGNAYLKEGLFEEAVLKYKEALALDQEYLPAYHNLGQAYLNKGMTDQAIEVYKKALAIEPAQAFNHYNLGNAYLSEGMFAQAISEYREALRLDPANLEIQKRLQELEA